MHTVFLFSATFKISRATSLSFNYFFNFTLSINMHEFSLPFNLSTPLRTPLRTRELAVQTKPSMIQLPYYFFPLYHRLTNPDRFWRTAFFGKQCSRTDQSLLSAGKKTTDFGQCSFNNFFNAEYSKGLTQLLWSILFTFCKSRSL